MGIACLGGNMKRSVAKKGSRERKEEREEERKEGEEEKKGK